jgi:membrane protease YdiL (CAAX protease family)
LPENTTPQHNGGAWKQRLRKGVRVLLFLLGVSIAFVAATGGAEWAALRLGLGGLAATSVGQGAMFVMTLLLVLMDGGFRPLGLTSRWKGLDVVAVPVLILIHLGLSVLFAVVMMMAGQQQPDSRQPAMQVFQQFAGYDAGLFPWIALGLALQAGIGEELLFRGYLISRLDRLGLGAWPSILISALLFGLVHAPGYGGLWPALSKAISFGLPTGAYFWYRRNLGPLMVAHTLTDWSSFMLLYIALKLMHGG